MIPGTYRGVMLLDNRFEKKLIDIYLANQISTLPLYATS